MKVRTLTVLAAFGALGLGACGGDDAAPATVAPSVAEPAVGVAAFNDADVEFAQGMIPHHEQAIEMADVALDPNVGASEQVRNIATRIKASQDPEIERMTGWLTEWGHPMTMDTSDGHDISTMDGMMTAEEMGSLASMTGAEFDKMWMEMMIRHHEGAIAMAQDAKANGSNAGALALTDEVIAAQQAEIAEMQALLGA